MATRKKQATARVLTEWRRRVEAEYRSAALTQHLVLWLIQIGASPDLLEQGLRIVRDELAHASLSHRVYAAAGGEEGPRMARETLELPRRPSDPLELDVARVCLDVFCFGETVAVRLFKALREGCTVPVARRALDRVLVDEVRHRDFGWALLGWMLEGAAAVAARAALEDELPRALGRLRAAYGGCGARETADVTEEEAAWGLMGSGRYGVILREAEQRDYVPRLRRLGVGEGVLWHATDPRVGGRSAGG